MTLRIEPATCTCGEPAPWTNDFTEHERVGERICTPCYRRVKEQMMWRAQIDWVSKHGLLMGRTYHLMACKEGRVVVNVLIQGDYRREKAVARALQTPGVNAITVMTAHRGSSKRGYTWILSRKLDGTWTRAWHVARSA